MRPSLAGRKTRRTPVRLALVAFVLLLTIDGPSGPEKVMAAGSAPPTADDLLQRLAPAPPDDCALDPARTVNSDAEFANLEHQLFDAVKAEITDGLNTPSPVVSVSAASRAASVLRTVEQRSAEFNKRWPDEDRFHFKILELPPAIVIEMSYRSHAGMALFGLTNLGKGETLEPGLRWRQVDFGDPDSAPSSVELFPLHRGPNGRPRFLARVWHSGCAGSIGENYYGYEWYPADGLSSNEVIKIEGAQGLDDSEPTRVGALSTKGPTIELPYCFFSAVDTWDNPTLCAADDFDLSGDEPVFSRRIYNSPDLATVAKAIEYAGLHDYLAVRGYCASDTVAKLLIRNLQPNLYSADTLRTIKAGARRETVVLGDDGFRFDLVKRQGQWLVDRFSSPNAN